MWICEFLKNYFILRIFTINFLSAQTNCFVGEVNYTINSYCDADGTWKLLKANGLSCGNDFECDIGTCSESVCGGRYESFSERGNLIAQIWNFLSGTECEPGEEGCEGTYFLMCGATGLWENKGPVDGKCGYVPTGCTEDSCEGEVYLECVDGTLVNRGNVNGQCGYSSGPGPGPGPGGCTPIWRCGNWSNLIQNCGTRICTDRNNCNKPQTKPIESKQCPGVASFCGDGACDANENENTCLVDCPKQSLCGDGTCSSDESSVTCSEDCKPIKPKSKMWIFWLIVFLFLAAIAGVGYAIYKKAIKSEKGVNANIELKKKQETNVLKSGSASNIQMKKPEMKGMKRKDN